MQVWSECLSIWMVRFFDPQCVIELYTLIIVNSFLMHATITCMMMMSESQHTELNFQKDTSIGPLGVHWWPFCSPSKSVCHMLGYTSVSNLMILFFKSAFALNISCKPPHYLVQVRRRHCESRKTLTRRVHCAVIDATGCCNRCCNSCRDNSTVNSPLNWIHCKHDTMFARR